MEARTSLPRRLQIVVVELIRGNRKEVTASQEEPAEIVFGYLNPSARASRYLSFRLAAPPPAAEAKPLRSSSSSSRPSGIVVASRSLLPFGADRRERRAAA